jgi:hypothetical protein
VQSDPDRTDRVNVGIAAAFLVPSDFDDVGTAAF